MSGTNEAEMVATMAQHASVRPDFSDDDGGGRDCAAHKRGTGVYHATTSAPRHIIGQDRGVPAKSKTDE